LGPSTLGKVTQPRSNKIIPETLEYKLKKLFKHPFQIIVIDPEMKVNANENP
jgi:hypothetical protein